MHVSERVRLPQLFGAYDRTALLVALHRAGPMRGATVRRLFSENIVKRGFRAYKSGIVRRIWQGPSLGYALAINDCFDASSALRRLLETLAKHCLPNALQADDEKIVGASGQEVPVDTSTLFGSNVRTATLLALETLGGETSTGVLAKGVTGQHPSSVKGAIRHFVNEGVLTKSGSRVSFSESAPWTEALRDLLRKMFAKETSDHCGRIESAFEQLTTFHEPSSLFTYRNSERFLVALATSGPARLRDVIAVSGSASEKRLRRLTRIGVLCRFVDDGVTYYSLNGAHPVYRELRELLCAMSDQASGDMAKRPDGAAYRPRFDIEQLFGRRLTTNVLVILAIASEIDASSLFRCLPEHDRQQIGLCLRRLQKSGILASQRRKTTLLYRLDDRWRAYIHLRSLLLAIARHWSDDYVDAYALAADLKPTLRRRMDALPVCRLAP